MAGIMPDAHLFSTSAYIMSYCCNTLGWRNTVCIISLNLLAARRVQGVQNGDATEPCGLVSRHYQRGITGFFR